MTYKILHRKLKIEQHEPYYEGAAEGLAVPAPLVAPVVLLLLHTSW
jgi:hypothetical protein